MTDDPSESQGDPPEDNETAASAEADGPGPDADEAGDRNAAASVPGDEREAGDDRPVASSATGPTDGTEEAQPDAPDSSADGENDAVPADVRSYERFQKIEGGTYERANDFLRERTYITAREWAIARLCADFRTETGVEMTKIGENLPELVPFMTDTYTPQAVNQARASFEEKVRMAGATFLYGAMSDFFTADELDDLMYEATEVAKFLLEVEGIELAVEEELAAEDRISDVMREVREHSVALRHDEVECPECGHAFRVDGEE